MQSNCLNIVINITLISNQLCKSKEVIGLANYIESTISLFETYPDESATSRLLSLTAKTSEEGFF